MEKGNPPVAEGDKCCGVGCVWGSGGLGQRKRGVGGYGLSKTVMEGLTWEVTAQPR